MDGQHKKNPDYWNEIPWVDYMILWFHYFKITLQGDCLCFCIKVSKCFTKKPRFSVMNDKFRFERMEDHIFIWNLGLTATSLFETWMPARNGVRGEVKGHAEHDIFNTAHGHMHWWWEFIHVELLLYTGSLFCVKRATAASRSIYFALFLSEKTSWSRRCRICIPRSGFEIHQKLSSRRHEGRDKGGLFVINILTSVFLQLLLCWKLCWSCNNCVEFPIFVTGCF